MNTWIEITIIGIIESVLAIPFALKFNMYWLYAPCGVVIITGLLNRLLPKRRIQDEGDKTDRLIAIGFNNCLDYIELNRDELIDSLKK